MSRRDAGDLFSFLAVARTRSFTRAAAGLGVSASALSHTIRNLEERLGVQLLARTTRSVAPTGAGERLIRAAGPHVEGIEAALADLAALRDKPAGALRLAAGDHAAETVLWPAVLELRRDYPDITVEIDVDNGLTDIVAGRYDAGVRLGERVDKDMIAARISPDLRMAVVGAPAYFATRDAPNEPADLTRHACINIRMPSAGGFYVWEFEKGGRETKVRVEGPLAFNSSRLALEAAIAGEGLAFVLEERALEFIDAGRLTRVLADWCPPFSGYHLYYSGRRQLSPAFSILVEKLRHRAGRHF
jgi:DNA-binding transcriptional LysR family regulator